MAQRLDKYIVRDALCSRVASGALTAYRLVTLDLVADAEGGKVKTITALTDKPFAAIEDGAADGATVGCIQGNAKIAIQCGDAAINADVEVFNDVAGKVSAVQGAGSYRVGVTRSKTDNLDEYVTVELDLPVEG